MPISFEQLVFEILGKDTSGSAALDRFRRKVDETTRSLDDNTGKLNKNAQSIDNLGKKADKSTPLLGALGGAGGMGLLIGAGVALSPVIATIGTGLGGLAVAAYGVAKPIENAAKKAGGLRANMASLNPEQQKVAQGLLAMGKQYDAFQKALQPEVLGVFGKALQLAGHLMKDVQPVAQATGKALGGLLDRVDKEFQSGQWQRFFSWMAANVGPDFKMIGNLTIDLLKTLPTLLQDLQPVAVGFLKFADAAVKAAGAYASFIAAEAHKANQPGSIADQIKDFLKYGYAGDKAEATANRMTAAQNALNARLNAGHVATADLIHPLGTFTGGLQTAKQATQNEALAVSILTNALKGLGTGLLTTEGDAVSWRQAQQAATTAIKANSGSLDVNKSAALAARQAIIASTQAALTFAQQEVNVHHNTDAATAIIRDQIRYLEQHAGKSRIATEEIDALRQALAKLARTPPIHESISMAGSGHWQVVAGGAHGGGSGVAFAGGGRVPGTGTGDTVPIWATPGEAVIPKHLVPAVAPFLRANQVPGFAAGGIIPSYSGGAGQPFRSWIGHDWNASISTISASMGNAMARAFQQSMSAAFMDSGARSGNAAIAQSFAASVLPRGWSFPALLSLWNQESGWNAYAVNPSSGAYGIAQSLGHGHPYNLGDYKAQIMWGIQYIAGRYGNSQNAWGHEMAFNWYDRGGYLPPGLSLAYNGTGRPERVGGGTTININVTVPPTVNPAQAGQEVAQLVLAYTKRGGRLYPQGMTPR